VEMGARVLTGGRRIDRPGNYYAPTVLADAPTDSPASPAGKLVEQHMHAPFVFAYLIRTFQHINHAGETVPA
jgi:hypothetical protein